MSDVDPMPAAVYDSLSNILAFNEGYRWLMGMDLYPRADHNVMVLRFTNDCWRRRVDPQMDTISVTVANFRVDYAQHMGEPEWEALIGRLRGIAQFDELWERHDVEQRGELLKRYQHPEAGVLTFTSVPLWLSPDSDMRLSFYSPADARSREALTRALTRSAHGARRDGQ